MSEASWSRRRSIGEGIIGAVSVGLFFVLIGVIFVINHNLWSNIQSFFDNFTIANVTNTSIQLPVPAVPAAHVVVYSAAFQFALGIAILQIIVLAIRLMIGSHVRRTAETVGNLVFWFGAAYFLNGLASMESSLAISKQQELWFQFWAVIIVLIGVSIVARAVVLFTARIVRRSRI